MIIDKETIYLRSGRGGEGNTSLRTVSSRKITGYGGDGGRGGDVLLKVNPSLYDLNKFKGNKKFIAANGEFGKGNNKKGKDAQDLFVSVPQGTRVLEGEELLVDLAYEECEFLVCRGGEGGKGNYKSNYPLPAKEGQERQVTLDYRIPNDVAILGFANSGKTSLFNALTGQNSKVAHYPFTTTSCFWANCEYEFKRFSILDTPPFKKSKDSSNLGQNYFLRHIFRSKILLLLSDKASGADEDFKDLKKEISLVQPSLIKGKKIFYLLSKVDTIDKEARGKNLRFSVKDPESIEKLKKKIAKSL